MFNVQLIYEVKENEGNLDPSVHKIGHQRAGLIWH